MTKYKGKNIRVSNDSHTLLTTKLHKKVIIGAWVDEAIAEKLAREGVPTLDRQFSDEHDKLNEGMIGNDDIKDLLKDFRVNAFSKVTSDMDNIIKQRLVENGFDPEDTSMLQRDFQFIHRLGDEFKHLHHIPSGKWIISVSDMPKITWTPNWDNFESNTVNCNMEYRYY